MLFSLVPSCILSKFDILSYHQYLNHTVDILPLYQNLLHQIDILPLSPPISGQEETNYREISPDSEQLAPAVNQGTDNQLSYNQGTVGLILHWYLSKIPRSWYMVMQVSGETKYWHYYEPLDIRHQCYVLASLKKKRKKYQVVLPKEYFLVTSKNIRVFFIQYILRVKSHCGGRALCTLHCALWRPA